MLTILHSANFWIGFAIGFFSLLALVTILYFIVKWAYDDLPAKKRETVYKDYQEFLSNAFDN